MIKDTAKKRTSSKTKDVLLGEIEELKAQNELLAKDKQKDDRLQSKYDICKQARAEDLETLNSSKNALSMMVARENELTEKFSMIQNQMKNTINEQTSVVYGLFEMMDSALNQQILFYNKYKEMFIPKQTGKEEPKE